jgi:anti-sigma B factor antagonist
MMACRTEHGGAPRLVRRRIPGPPAIRPIVEPLDDHVAVPTFRGAVQTTRERPRLGAEKACGKASHSRLAAAPLPARGCHKTVIKLPAHFSEFGRPESCKPVMALALMPCSPNGQTTVMPISISDLDGNVTKVVLTGRIDIVGAREIEMPMAVVAGSRRAVVVDLSAVEFMASLGLRGIVVSARSIISKRGKIVLLMPQPQVEEVIITTGIDQLVPIFHDETAAIAAVIPKPG